MYRSKMEDPTNIGLWGRDKKRPEEDQYKLKDFRQLFFKTIGSKK